VTVQLLVQKCCLLAVH